jgi:methionyl-tRNA synthetase
MMSFRMREALGKILQLSSSGNSYLNSRKPWELESKEAATAIYVALHLIKALAIMLYPYIPSSSQKIWNQLGYSDDISAHRWEEIKEPVPVGQTIPEPKPIFRKLTDEDIKKATEKIEELRSQKAV